jgi:putative methanogenesis marker protein 17
LQYITLENNHPFLRFRGNMAYIDVECNDEAGKAIYERIIQTSLEDLVLGKSIIKAKMICKQDVPYFIIGILPKSTSKLIRLRDIATIDESKKSDGKTITKLNIDDETYATELLAKINVMDQPSRFEIVTDSEVDLNMVIHDAKEDFVDRVLDFMNRVFPEGMRIRKTIRDKTIVMVASEKPIEQDWMDEAVKLQEELKIFK